nr:MAG TPA: hypothetical protein [Caudoviricetes sp.]
MEMDARSVLLFVDINTEILKIIKIAVKDKDETRIKLTASILPVYQEFIGLSEEKIKKNKIISKLENIIRSFYKESLISKYRCQKIIRQLTNFKSSMNLE